MPVPPEALAVAADAALLCLVAAAVEDDIMCCRWCLRIIATPLFTEAAVDAWWCLLPPLPAVLRTAARMITAADAPPAPLIAAALVVRLVAAVG